MKQSESPRKYATARAFFRTHSLSPGKHTLELDFKYDGLGSATLAFNNLSGIGRPGAGTFTVDGQVVSTQALERTIPLVLPWGRDFRHRAGFRHAGR